jgi:TolB-like protein
MTMRSVVASRIACLVCLLASSSAMARERLVVMVAAAGDAAELGDDLTEVMISRLAESTDRELVGGRDLRRRLSALVADRDLAACLADTACVARIANAVGGQYAVTGIVTAAGETRRFDATLVDVRTGIVEARAARVIAGDVEALIGAVQDVTGQLLEPKVEPKLETKLETKNTDLTSGSAQAKIPALELAPSGSPERPPAGRSISRNLAYGAVALAVVVFSAASVTGIIASGHPPANSTRIEAQRDLEHRETYATTTNELLVGGAVLVAGATVGFLW